MIIEELRKEYHHNLAHDVISIDENGVPNNADKSSKTSVALGTGDIDCVYHFALNELKAAAGLLNNDSASDMLDTLVKGKRLRDISDLPFDLVT